MNQRAAPAERDETRLAWLLVAPALAVILLVALVPIAVTAWEALHLHDLRLPWLGTPFIGAGNFVEAAGNPRFGAALFHTMAFALISVPLELMLGLALAVMMHSVVRGRAFIRVSALLPWAIPTVVAALLWRFMFEARTGILAASFQAIGLVGPAFDWFVHPLAAWVPIGATNVLEDFTLRGNPASGRAGDDRPGARGSGADRRREPGQSVPARSRCRSSRPRSSLPRHFGCSMRCDCSIWRTSSRAGAGTATEPLSLYAFIALMQRLRFGYGSALSVTVFLLTFAFALVWVRALGRSLTGARS